MSGRPATALLWTMLPLLLLLDISTTAAATAQPPFSWDTVPVFAETSNVTGPFDERALATLRRFPLFVAEKAYDYPGPGFAEDKLTALAGHLRQLNPEIFLVFYYNANLDMDDYRLNAMSAAAAPSWWLRNSSGVPLVAPVDSGAGARPPFPYASNSLGGLHCWDHTNPTVREAWVQVCVCVSVCLSLSLSLCARFPLTFTFKCKLRSGVYVAQAEFWEPSVLTACLPQARSRRAGTEALCGAASVGGAG